MLANLAVAILMLQDAGTTSWSIPDIVAQHGVGRQVRNYPAVLCFPFGRLA